MIAAREYPAMEILGEPTLVTIGDGPLADGIDRALGAIAALPASRLLGEGIIAGRTTIADLATTYTPDELRDV